MIPDSVYNRITDYHYRLTTSDELYASINETLLQAIWDSQESIKDDELVTLAAMIIREYYEMCHKE